jgi:hypothetical protein
MTFSVTFDATDHVVQADWWAETLGWERRSTDPDPEAKSAKNRVFCAVLGRSE